jgi:hypothetical protein
MIASVIGFLDYLLTCLSSTYGVYCTCPEFIEFATYDEIEIGNHNGRFL